MNQTITCRHCGAEIPAAAYALHAWDNHRVVVHPCVPCARAWETAAGLADHLAQRHPAPSAKPAAPWLAFGRGAPDVARMTAKERLANARQRVEEAAETMTNKRLEAAQFRAYQAQTARERAERQRAEPQD